MREGPGPTGSHGVALFGWRAPPLGVALPRAQLVVPQHVVQLRRAQRRVLSPQPRPRGLREESGVDSSVWASRPPPCPPPGPREAHLAEAAPRCAQQVGGG